MSAGSPSAQAQAVGGKRNYGGWLGRADRLMLLLVVSLIQYLMIQFSETHEIAEYYLLTWLMVLFILSGNLNAIQRVYDTWTELGDAGPGEERARGTEYTSHDSDGGVLRGRRVDAGRTRVSSDEDDDIEWKGK